MTLVVGVLIASMLGSVHCGAMCSAFACLANGGARRGVWYHGGRLLAYSAYGAIAGVAGVALDLAGRAAHVQRVAVLLTGVALVVWGVVQLSRAMYQRRPRQLSSTRAPLAPTPRARGLLAYHMSQLVARTTQWNPRARAMAIGLVTALLPCAWLWAFVATAMGTGSPWRGAIVMAAFWAGTVPMLVTVASGVRRFGPLARVRWPIASATLVVLLGLSELAAHAWLVDHRVMLTGAHVMHAARSVSP